MPLHGSQLHATASDEKPGLAPGFLHSAAVRRVAVPCPDPDVAHRR